MTDRSAAAKKAWVTMRRKKEIKLTVERTKRYLEQRANAKVKDFTKEVFALFDINEEVIYDNKRTVITAIQDNRVQVRGHAKWIPMDKVSEL